MESTMGEDRLYIELILIFIIVLKMKEGEEVKNIITDKI